MTLDIPTLGTLLLGAILVSASFTFAVSAAAAGGRPHLLRSARFGTFATIALVAAAVFLLEYAFQSHDFRLSYVARYSDRSMPAIYLWTALWGGQDGSLLWWTFLLSGYIGLFTWWVKDKFREMQPVMFATLMSVVAFFIILQLFAANPFATTFGAPPADGEGLNPLLQNYWMVIHPPALYLGLTGWAIPFAFVMGALVTGRLGNEWILGVRKWVLLAWGFLSLGNMLGMFWSYEELGWGGYWAWDPVENASFLPWLTATAYLHSVMIQERRGTLKVWGVFLLSGTFILTIFGTFLTRSGLIASVHSFARSDIGIYFGWYLAALCVTVFCVIGWRLLDLRGGKRIGWMEFVVSTLIGLLGALFFGAAGIAETWRLVLLAIVLGPLVIGLLKTIELFRLFVVARPAQESHARKGIESLVSREFAFLLQNWILLGMAVFIALATTFPLISELLRGETVTVGPGYYNKWMVPFGLVVLTLTGIGPLIAWRKATGRNLVLAFRWPTLFAVVVGALHLGLGEYAGFAPFVAWDELYESLPGQVLAAIYSACPLASTTVCAFVLGTVVQEFWRGTAVRMRMKNENPIVALYELVTRARRRYGGYTVHVGVVLMFLGFTGAAYDVEVESSLLPGQSMTVGDYEVRYDGVRMEEDPNKRMVFTDLTVLVDGEPVARVEPAKFIYRSHPEMPTTEVAIRSTLLHDLYVIMSTVDPQTQRGTFRVILRPVVIWIWLGGLVLLLGLFIAIAPSIKDILGEARAPSPSDRTKSRAASAATLVLVLLGGGTAWALAPPNVASAQADSSSSLHAGTVVIDDPEERRLFERLLCECGDCQRLPLDSCGCGWAEGMRAELRGKLGRGDEVAAIIEGYRTRFGAQAIAVPSDEGLDRALWAVPVGAIFLAAIGLVWRARSWARVGSRTTSDAAREAAEHPDEGAAYDDQLEEELDALEGD